MRDIFQYKVAARPGNSVYFGSQAPSQKKVQEPKKKKEEKGEKGRQKKREEKKKANMG